MHRYVYLYSHNLFIVFIIPTGSTPASAIRPAKTDSITSVELFNKGNISFTWESKNIAVILHFILSLLSFEISFSGANFPSIKSFPINGNSLSSLTSTISLCGRGTSVSFDKVRVKFPDGTIKPIAPLTKVLQ